MRISQGGLDLGNPAWPLLQGELSYEGTTDVIGNAAGTTLQDTLCSTAGLQPSYAGQIIKLITSDAAGQIRPIAIHALATGIITVTAPWTDYNGAVYQIPAGTKFKILSATGGGGVGPVPTPDIGLWFFGVCNPGMAASTTVIVATNLAGLSEDILNNRFWMQILHDDSAPGTAPEREIRRILDYVSATGTFTTDAFSANIEANDSFCVFHESIMGIEILGYGTLDTSSMTVPADSTRAAAYVWENNEYFKGCILMPTEGACRFQPRPIRSYASATGVFTLDEPFTALPGAVDYIIIGSDYPVQRLVDIFNLVNAMLVTTETGGTITTDGAVQNVYINNAPAGVYEPLAVTLDLTGMTAAETIVVTLSYRNRPPAAAMVVYDQVTYVGVQPVASKGKIIDLTGNRYGVLVTLQATAGGPIDIPWDAIYRV